MAESVTQKIRNAADAAKDANPKAEDSAMTDEEFLEAIRHFDPDQRRQLRAALLELQGGAVMQSKATEQQARVEAKATASESHGPK